MRVVGGRLKGRNLASPSTNGIRPTADRLRESLFNILIHAYDDPLAEARVLDLFAGTGALGIEAVSRGALLVVEEHKAAFAAPDGFAELERRAYDDTEFTFLRFGEVPAQP